MKTITKIVCLLLCLGMIGSVFAACSSPKGPGLMPSSTTEDSKQKNNSQEEPKGLQYTLLENGTYEVSVGTELDALSIEIPAVYQGIEVSSIAERAFDGCSALERIVIPNGIKMIGNGAFEGCVRLQNVTIPASVTRIGDGVFGYCESLASITVVPANKEYSSIDGVLYNKDKNQLVQYAPGKTATTFDIPISVTSIRNEAFLGCLNLTNIKIPGNMTAIGEEAFKDCDALAQISIPEKITHIAAGTFRNCDKLESVTMEDGVENIGVSAFENCASLTVLDLPNSLQTIENSAFKNCVLLKTIDLPDDITKIGYDAFYQTGYYQESKNWENNVLYLGKHLIVAKNGPSDTYTVKEGTKTIADHAFSNCFDWTEIIFSQSLVSVGDCAFYWCSDLKVVTIFGNVTKLGASSFESCFNLEKIAYKGSEAQWESVEKSEAKIPEVVIDFS